jgi:hypothetical protein
LSELSPSCSGENTGVQVDAIGIFGRSDKEIEEIHPNAG